VPRRALVAVLVFAVLLVRPSLVGAGERVDITAMDGVQLIGDLEGTTGPGLVLVDGPIADVRSAGTARTIAAAGFRVLRFDFRGAGASSGASDLGAADRDLEGAYRYLLARKVRPVYLAGSSVGASAALIVAGRVPVAGVAVIGEAPTVPLDPRPARAALRVPVLTLPARAEAADVGRALVQWLRDPTRADGE
jgi:alpha/beta superfamily hydrolase